jgi:hypothetical protein
LSHGSGVKKSKIKVLPELVPFGGSEGETIPCHSFSFYWMWAILGVPWLSVHHSILCFLYPCVLSVSGSVLSKYGVSGYLGIYLHALKTLENKM